MNTLTLFLFFTFSIFLSTSLFAEEPWRITITQRGGKLTPCGTYYYVRHSINPTSRTETINCSGKGPNECPSPTHSSNSTEPGIIAVEKAVMEGKTSGTIVLLESLEIAIYSNGKVNGENDLDYDVDIYLFENLEDLQSFLNNRGL